jgi:hypothetical protein
VINALNRATTIANRRPVASSFPSKAGKSAPGTGSTLNLIFSSVISVSSVVNLFRFKLVILSGALCREGSMHPAASAKGSKFYASKFPVLET